MLGIKAGIQAAGLRGGGIRPWAALNDVITLKGTAYAENTGDALGSVKVELTMVKPDGTTLDLSFNVANVPAGGNATATKTGAVTLNAYGSWTGIAKALVLVAGVWVWKNEANITINVPQPAGPVYTNVIAGVITV